MSTISVAELYERSITPNEGDWVMEELSGAWEVFRVGGRRGRVFSLEEAALAVVHENAARSGGQVWRRDRPTLRAVRVVLQNAATSG
jgi:hypothetical protein